jgi:hypothetical protein
MWRIEMSERELEKSTGIIKVTRAVRRLGPFFPLFCMTSSMSMRFAGGIRWGI